MARMHSRNNKQRIIIFINILRFNLIQCQINNIYTRDIINIRIKSLSQIKRTIQVDIFYDPREH